MWNWNSECHLRLIGDMKNKMENKMEKKLPMVLWKKSNRLNTVVYIHNFTHHLNALNNQMEHVGNKMHYFAALEPESTQTIFYLNLTIQSICWKNPILNSNLNHLLCNFEELLKFIWK